MAAYTWPSTLPQIPLLAGHDESLAVNVLRTPMDSGPAKTRRRSRRIAPSAVAFNLTAAQVAILEAFIRDTLLGVRRFNFNHPRTQAVVEARIVPDGEGRLYALAPLGRGLWQASMTLEVLP